MKASSTADPGATSLLHHRCVSWDIIQALSTLGLRRSTCHICSLECRPGREREKARRGHCVTTERRIFLLLFPFPSCVRMTQLLSPGSTSVFLSARRPSGSRTRLADTSLSCKVHGEKKKKHEKAVRELSPWKNDLRFKKKKQKKSAGRWKNITSKLRLGAPVIRIGTKLCFIWGGVGWGVDCCHETHCFAVFLPARHFSAKMRWKVNCFLMQSSLWSRGG